MAPHPAGLRRRSLISQHTDQEPQAPARSDPEVGAINKGIKGLALARLKLLAPAVSSTTPVYSGKLLRQPVSYFMPPVRPQLQTNYWLTARSNATRSAGVDLALASRASAVQIFHTGVMTKAAAKDNVALITSVASPYTPVALNYQMPVSVLSSRQRTGVSFEAGAERPAMSRVAPPPAIAQMPPPNFLHVDAAGIPDSLQTSPESRSTPIASSTTSTLLVDGSALGRWAVQYLERALGRPATGMTGVDPRANLPRSRVAPF